MANKGRDESGRFIKGHQQFNKKRRGKFMPCQNCGDNFWVYNSWLVQKGKYQRKFCSRSCCTFHRNKNVKTMAEKKEWWTNYYKKHKEKLILKAIKWNAENKQEHYKHTVKHRKKEVIKYRFYKKQRHYREKNAIGSFTLEQWEELKTKYNHTCPACNKKEPEIVLTVDHVVPLSKGGSNTIDNIQPLCGSCNSKKFTKELRYG